MSDQGERRRTQRTTAGKLFNRYGNPVSNIRKPRESRLNQTMNTSGAEQPPQGATTSTSTTVIPQSATAQCKPPSTAKSVRTVKSNLALQIANINQDLETAISAAEQQYQDKCKELASIKLINKGLMQEAAEVESDYQAKAPSLNEDERNALKQQVKEKRDKLTAHQSKVSTLEMELSFAAKDMERKKRLLQAEAEVKRKKAEAEADEEEDKISEAERMKSVDDWAQGTVIQPKAKKASGSSSSDYESVRSKESEEEDEEEVHELTERLKRLRNVPDKKTLPPKDPDMQVFADVLTMAFKRALPKQDLSKLTSTDKLLSRQVQGRDLPVFSGKPEEWPSFMAAYESSTKNCGYNHEDNLPRLRRCLKDEALRTVQCMLVTPANVPLAIEKLRKRFGRPEVIIQNLIKIARESPPVKIDKPESYIQFGLIVDDLTSTINSLGCEEYMSNPLLLEDLVRKLPFQQQIEWAKLDMRKSRTRSLKHFSKWLNQTTEAVYTLCPPKSVPDKSSSSGYRNRKRSTERVYTMSEDRPNIGQKEKKCSVCTKTSHLTRECSQLVKEEIQKRWDIVKEKRICFGCLNRGHRFQECRSKRDCGVNGCKLKHHFLLHQERSKPESITTATTIGMEQSKVEEEIVHTACEDKLSPSAEGPVKFMMCPVYINCADSQILCYAVLDSYSSITTIDKATMKLLGLKGTPKPLAVKGFNTISSYPDSCSVDISISPYYDEDKIITLQGARTVEKMNLEKQTVDESLLTKWPHLSSIKLPTYRNEQPKILIGLDNPHLHVQYEYREGKGPNAPIAVRTALGWMLMGRMGNFKKRNYSFGISEQVEDPLHSLVKHFFSTEAFGVNPQAKPLRSKDDIRAQDIMDSTLRKISDGWEVGLLWKDNDAILPDSKYHALTRLKQMERKMDRDPVFAKQYETRIEEYIAKGYARKLSSEEASVVSPRTYYLPHFMAFNPKKAKLRFVFDAAAKINGRSLNDFLLQGPDKLPSLPGILLNFRMRAIGITADISDMFHRVRVRKQDADSQRFLWRGLNREKEPDVMQMEVLIFGATCSPTCAQEAKNRNAEQYESQYPQAYNTIVKKHYVDDCLDSCDTPKEAIRLQQEICHIHRQGGFNLCNWLSNSREVMEAIPVELRAKSMKNLDMSDVDLERVLGLFWRPEEDSFTFSLSYLKAQEKVLKGEKPPTKREVLSLVMSIYDPLGFLSTLTVKAKIIMQAAWKANITWDDQLPPTLMPFWISWLEELQMIPTFNLPRCYSPSLTKAEEVQLHVFGDASEEAFGAVIYLRITTAKSIETALVMAKSRVAPLKQLSIPRLELQAAVMGARLAKFIQEELEIKINRVVFWSDSANVLSWIRADGKRFQQFVGHRIGEIQELSHPSQWRWIPTNLNVADEMTRITSKSDWSPTSRWIHGPEFLLLDEESWPREKANSLGPISESELEMRRNQVFSIKEVTPIINLSRFSKWTRLIRATAYVLRFANAMRKKPINQATVSLEEIREAESWWWRRVQEESYPEELKALQERKPIQRSSKLHKTSVFLDPEGVIRVKGRLDNANLPLSIKHPVVLYPKHHYTKLFLDDFHRRCGHHGQERIANEIRQNYHVPRLRVAVRSAQSRCQVCRLVRAKPQPPEMGQLPTCRLENVFPFNQTGLDYFGPISIIVKRTREKRYVALFTCLSTRAVHLEIAGSLNTDSCIMAIRRFVSRRGSPDTIHSDNGTNFVGANNELKAALAELNQIKLEDECKTRGINWRFNPPSAPHMGGSWERMVRSVKVALGDVLHQKSLHEESLHTLLTEAEHTVNSHPLTHVPEDPEDQEALTPNHFLLGRTSNLQPIGHFSRDELFGRKQWRTIQILADQFWQRWVKEYIPTLRKREKWQQSVKPIQEGDVVIEVNPNNHRNCWPKGRVIKLYPGKDGITRVVDMRLSNGHVFKRPVAKLCILPVCSPTDED